MPEEPEAKVAIYECNPCTYWEATHAIKGFSYADDPKYKNCQQCRKRVIIYRDWVERTGGA